MALLDLENGEVHRVRCRLPQRTRSAAEPCVIFRVKVRGSKFTADEPRRPGVIVASVFFSRSDEHFLVYCDAVLATVRQVVIDEPKDIQHLDQIVVLIEEFE